MHCFVRGHTTEWEVWESPQKMFPPSGATQLCWPVPGACWSVWAIGDRVDKALERSCVGRGGHQPPSRHLLSVISLVYSHSHHQRPCGEALWKCGGGISPPHAPGTWVGCGHHCSLSTHISQPRTGAPRSFYPQLPRTSLLTSQSPSWHQHPTPSTKHHHWRHRCV